MRLSKLLFWMLLCGAMTLVSTAAQAQATNRVAGRIVVVRVQGTVTATNLADNAERTLVNNDTLTQQMVVKTGAGASAILVFSNGATLNLGADSTLSIDEFLQDPFEKELSLADLKEEPTSSTTKLNLSRGELVGNVKHLHEDQGSTFTVNTPVGAAGIRGTTFRIVFRPDASGKVFFTLSTADGRVLFEAPASDQAVAVSTGNEVVVTVDVQVDAATGTVTLTTPPVVSATQEISPASQAAIATATQQIVEASSAAIISSAASDAADKAAADKAAAEKDAAEKAAAEKAAAEKAAADKAAADKAAADKAAADKAAADKASSDKKSGDSSSTDTNGTQQPLSNDPTSGVNTPPPRTTSGDGQ